MNVLYLSPLAFETGFLWPILSLEGFLKLFLGFNDVVV
jgi:hypothetical protein